MPYRQSSGRGCGPWPFPRLCVDALFRRCLKPLFCVCSSRHLYSSTLSIRRHFYLDRYRQRHQKKQKTRKGAWRYKEGKNKYLRIQKDGSYSRKPVPAKRRRTHQKIQKIQKCAWRYKKVKISTYGYTRTEIILGNPFQQGGEVRIGLDLPISLNRQYAWRAKKQSNGQNNCSAWDLALQKNLYGINLKPVSLPHSLTHSLTLV